MTSTPANSDTTKLPAESRPLRTWRDVWQVPVLGLAVLALVGGIVTAVMTAPKPDHTGGLDAAVLLVKAGKFGDALEELNRSVLPHMAGEALTPDDRRLFHVLRARALYLGQREIGLDRTENNENIKKEYGTAEGMHAVLGPDDNYYLAQTLISLGEYGDAANRAELLADTDRARRIELLKRLIVVSMAHGESQRARALDLVTTLASEPDLSRDDRVWTLVRQSELLISGGYAGDAITKILRALPRLDGIDATVDGELRVTLAKAYLSEGAMEDASRQLETAAERLGPDHALAPLVTLLRAEIDHHDGELARAKERYLEVIERYAFDEGRPAALLGLAEVEAQLSNTQSGGNQDASLDRYSQLVDLMRSGASDHASIDRIGHSLFGRFQEQFDKKDFGVALRFGGLTERLYGVDGMPTEMILGLAETRKRLAEELLRHAAGDGAMLSLAQADPATQREAREHLIRAGDHYKVHASRVVQSDTKAYGESLWNAADAFDRAGDVDASVQAFQQFTSDFPNDQRQPEAAFRLAQAYRARGDLELAARLYQRLVEERGRMEGSGPFGDQSMVPLAVTLLGDADKDNDTRAEEILQQVVSGEVVGPGTEIFREALRELGDHLHHIGRHAPAIERFEQYLALAADGSVENVAPVRYRLAEAYRRSGAEISRSLEAGMPDGTKRALRNDRTRRLERALTLYEAVRREYDAKEHRTGIEDLYLRNAYFFQGDCAFDLKDYDAAIRYYDAARERYSKDPASLMAMTQTVNALLALGRTEHARIANDKAKQFLSKLPDSVWDDPNLPMNRDNWKTWLESQDQLTGSRSANSATGREQ